MEILFQQKCEACQVGAPKVSEEEAATLLTQVSDWQILDVDGEKRLQRVFSFKNFKRALAFTNRVGDVAEAEGHHPELITEWGRVTVSWWSHKIHGLHKNDFIMAAKTDALFSADK